MSFTQQHVDDWRKDGFCVVPDFFTPEEIEPLLKDFEVLYEEAAQPADQSDPVFMDPNAEEYLQARERNSRIFIPCPMKAVSS